MKKLLLAACLAFPLLAVGASSDEALIEQTRVARGHGLRGDFEGARNVLKNIEPALAGASSEVLARHALEWGRTWASATHPPANQTPEALREARAAYQRALQLAREGGLDALAIDAIHMFAFVDKAPADQLKWAREALAISTRSTQPAARAWEASLRNNAGYALHGLGRFEEALEEFRKALELRERGSNVKSTRIAHWMVAWTLRAMGRYDEAIAIQLRLEKEWAEAGAPDPHVFAELELLYRAKGDEARAAHYSQKRRSS